MDTKTYEAYGLHQSLSDVDPVRVVNGRANREIQGQLSTPADRQYNPCPEASPGDDVPRSTDRVAFRSDPNPAQAHTGQGCEPVRIRVKRPLLPSLPTCDVAGSVSVSRSPRRSKGAVPIRIVSGCCPPAVASMREGGRRMVTAFLLLDHKSTP